MRERHRFVRARPNVVSVHQPMQLFAAQLDHVLLEQARPCKLLSALDDLAPQTESIDIPSEDLQRGVPLVGEQKAGVAERILLHHFTSNGGESVTSRTHVNRCTMQ